MDTEGQLDHECPEVEVPVLGPLVVMLADCINFCLTQWLQAQLMTLKIYFSENLLFQKRVCFPMHSIHFEKGKPPVVITP